VGGILRIRELGLGALELGWVNSVRVSEKSCQTIQDTAQAQGIRISVHAPYFINLNANDEEWPKSRKRLMDAAHYGNLAGATDIIFPEKDMAIRTARSLSAPNIIEHIPLGEDFAITEIAPPRSFIGKNLVELDLRNRYRITVLGIRDVLTEEFTALPPAQRLIRDSDILVLAGRPEDVEEACKK